MPKNKQRKDLSQLKEVMEAKAKSQDTPVSQDNGQAQDSGPEQDAKFTTMRGRGTYDGPDDIPPQLAVSDKTQWPDKDFNIPLKDRYVRVKKGVWQVRLPAYRTVKDSNGNTVTKDGKPVKQSMCLHDVWDLSGFSDAELEEMAVQQLAANQLKQRYFWHMAPNTEGYVTGLGQEGQPFNVAHYLSHVTKSDRKGVTHAQVAQKATINAIRDTYLTMLSSGIDVKMAHTIVSAQLAKVPDMAQEDVAIYLSEWDEEALALTQDTQATSEA